MALVCVSTPCTDRAIALPPRRHPTGAAGISAFILCTVLTPTPRVLATFSIPSPAARRLRIAPSVFVLTFDGSMKHEALKL